MRKKLLNIISTISLALIMMFTPILAQGINSKSDGERLEVQTRTVAATTQTLDVESIFNSYEDAKLENDGVLTTFEGTKSFKLSDFEELDLVSDTNVEASVDVKYTYTYDSERQLIYLSAKLIDSEDLELVDTIVGIPFINDAGDLDAIFDLDGNIMLLSEMQDLGMIENCGWLKNLCKKVTKVANKVATTVKKTVTTTVTAVTNVAKTTAAAVATGAQVVGKFVYDNADVILPVAIGVVGGLASGALVPVLIAGTLTGAVIDGAKTAVASYKATGKVDWAATGISAAIGGAVGFVATYTGYDIGTALRPETYEVSNNTVNNTQNTNSKKSTSYNSYSEFTKANGTANNSSVKYGVSTNGNYEWHHIVEQNQINNGGISPQNIYSTKNTISLGYDTHRQISSIYSTNVDNLAKYNIDGLQKLFSNAQKGQTVRSYLSTLSFDQQYELGKQILRLLGVDI